MTRLLSTRHYPAPVYTVPTMLRGEEPNERGRDSSRTDSQKQEGQGRYSREAPAPSVFSSVRCNHRANARAPNRPVSDVRTHVGNTPAMI